MTTMPGRVAVIHIVRAAIDGLVVGLLMLLDWPLQSRMFAAVVAAIGVDSFITWLTMPVVLNAYAELAVTERLDRIAGKGKPHVS